MGVIKKLVNTFLLTIFILLLLSIVFGFAGLLPEKFFSGTSLIILFPYFVVQGLMIMH